jgi:hypothetical protein
MTRLIRSNGFRAVWVAVAACCLGARPQCDVTTPGPPCDEPSVIVVEPGTCVELPDPCGNGWADLQTISFTHAPAGLWFEVHRRPTGTTVSICAADTIGLTAIDTAAVRIVGDSGDLHDTDIRFATVPLLSAFATSVPETVNVLDTLQLVANVTGGVPPYMYDWWCICSQSEFIGATDQRTALVCNATCDQYRLFVRDSLGTRDLVFFRIPTYPGVTLTATPAVIDSGEASYLEAKTPGIEMLGIYWWEPTTGLNTPGRLWTYARPDTTTTYTVYVKTNLGMVSSDTATVTVRE